LSFRRPVSTTVSPGVSAGSVVDTGLPAGCWPSGRLPLRLSRMQGKLYVVATPLGNLGDLTFRAAELLKRVPIVAAEDTRRTRQLLHHLDGHPRLISFHGHSPESRLNEILTELARGQDVALVSDAGTPVISDPGAELVARARAAGCTIIPIPGLSAVTAAISASGLPGDRYLFLGFVPRKGKERSHLLDRACREEWSVVFYEAPNRLVGLLRDLADLAGGERKAVVARELTKLHEEVRAGTLKELADYFDEKVPRGEITLVLAGSETPLKADPPPVDIEQRAAELLEAGHTRKGVVRILVDESGLARNEVYRRVMDIPS
jgi:16S rRNA (cytidine1402-2'-O)-methyltransferase